MGILFADTFSFKGGGEMLASLWKGEESLSFAFLFFVAGGLVFWYLSGLLILALQIPNQTIALVALFLLRTSFFGFIWIAVWRCSSNTGNLTLTRAAKLVVILHAALFFAIQWAMFYPLLRNL